MTRQTNKTKSILRAVQRSNLRSPLFWWMVEHHDEIEAASAGQRISWKAFCERASAEGLTDTRGRPPTERNARETWRVARAAVAAQRRAAAAKPSRPGSVYPSRISPDWRPQEVLPPAVTTPASSLPALASAGAGPAALPAPNVPRPAQQAGPRLLVPFADNRTQEEIDAYVDEQLSLIHR